ncbi:unnamed protein product [Pieris macdunnoughi]|uniref:Uncharacterized protein n=1 Tax=Pieris macdunnoughi TaxID=345717 RepID=A0A821VU77_9NEOP|nr:unnamed protein product [Pieris macdunnoughi]
MKVRIPIVIGRRIQPQKVDEYVENHGFTYKRNNELIKARNVEKFCRSNALASINNVNSGSNRIIDENNEKHSRKRDLSNKDSLYSVASKMAVDLLNTKRWLNLNPRKVKKQKGKQTELKNRTENSRRQSDYMDSRNDMALMKHLKKLRKNKVRRDDREEELQYDFDEEELNYE